MTHQPAAGAPNAAETSPVLSRFRVAGFGSPELESLVAALGSRSEALPAKGVLQTEGAPVRRPRYLVAGWACRFRHLSDGRRQIFDFVLPGEGVGVCLRPSPLAHTSVAALTPVRLIDATPLLRAEARESCRELVPALQAQAAADERRMLDHIVRLGRLSALERLSHLVLDLHDRLRAIGRADEDRFPWPLTQETLADALGLSVVHVNRTLQELRRQDLVWLERGVLRLPDRDALARSASYEVVER